MIKVLREATAKAVKMPEFVAAMEKMETPIAYLDAPEFKKFWDKDADAADQGGPQHRQGGVKEGTCSESDSSASA